MQRDVTWRELLSSRLDREDQDVIRLFRILLESLNTPVSLGAHLRLKYGGIASLLEMQINPSHYLTADSFAVDYQVVKFLAKYPFKNSPFDTKAQAINTFEQGEAKCKVENEFWRAYERGDVELEPKYNVILFKAQAIIGEILGKFPIQEWLDSCRFGPGTFAYAGVPNPSDACKLTTNPGVTQEFAPFAKAFLREYPGWLHTLTLGNNIPLDLVVGQSGKFTTVPKTARTDRCIEIQPLLNLFAQLGLGRCIRRRLLDATGIDLDHQSDINRELARKGSVHGGYATIDLSNASDSICAELVKQLLPSDWYHALNITRTHTVDFEGEIRPLERFSAMGNGFTFELETLIFYAISRATCLHGRVVCFGDDIIVPTLYASDVCGYLEKAGFTVNRNKSFITGPFRESCGADWFLGTFVRPYLLDDRLEKVTEIVSMANGLARWALYRNHGYGFDYRVRPVWLQAVRWIPPRIRARLAWGFPDTDEYLFAWRDRGNRRILPVAQTTRLSSWYQAKATALYRVYARRIKNEEAVGKTNVVQIPREAAEWKFVPLDRARRAWGDPMVYACQRVVRECGWC